MNYIANLHSAIEELVVRFQRNPYDFLYESDLQSMLFSLLERRFADEKIAMTGGYWPSADYGGRETIYIIPVKSEYPLDGGPGRGQRFDIALIDPSTVRNYDPEIWPSAGLKNDAFWTQPVLAAVELKYLQLGEDRRQRRRGCDDDVGKLCRYLSWRGHNTFLGLSILFIQSQSVDARFAFDDDWVPRSGQPTSGLARYIISPSEFLKFSV